MIDIILATIAIISALVLAYITWKVNNQLETEQALNNFLRKENSELRRELQKAKRNDYRDAAGRFKKAPKKK